MLTHTTELRFGRNTNLPGGRPLIDELWSQFGFEAVELLEKLAAAIGTEHHWIETHGGTGFWTCPSTGVTIAEQSKVVTLYWVPAEWTPEISAAPYLPALAPEIAQLAARYNQDAIAVVDGKSVLVSAKAVTA